MYPLLPLDYMYHPVHNIKIPILSIDVLQNNDQVYALYNYGNIRSYIASISWDYIFKNVYIYQAVDIFNDNVYNIINLFSPKKCLYILKNPVWFCSALKK